MIIFKLKEVQSRYNISGKALAAQLGVTPSVVSDWRCDKKTPTLEKTGKILEAILAIADQEKLKVQPLSLTDLVEWKPDRSISAR